MERHTKSGRRLLAAGAAALLTCFGLGPALEPIVEGTPVAPVVSALGIAQAEAQTTWGTARRTGRRGGRRAARRHDYMYDMPAGYTTVQQGPTTVYVSDGAEYVPQMVEGRVVYVPAG